MSGYAGQDEPSIFRAEEPDPDRRISFETFTAMRTAALADPTGAYAEFLARAPSEGWTIDELPTNPDGLLPTYDTIVGTMWTDRDHPDPLRAACGLLVERALRFDHDGDGK